MTTRKLLLATLFASSLGAALPAAAAHVDLFVNVPPPAPVYEVAPAPRPGWVWVPGYYEWHHGHHVWVRGHWVRERRGYVYVPGAWVARDGRYYWNEPRWEREAHAHGMRDRDHDGVPDRYDRAPNNPYVR
jgi:hypothetical protein